MDDGSYGSKFIEILPFEKPTKRPDISDVTHQKVEPDVIGERSDTFNDFAEYDDIDESIAMTQQQERVPNHQLRDADPQTDGLNCSDDDCELQNGPVDASSNLMHYSRINTEDCGIQPDSLLLDSALSTHLPNICHKMFTDTSEVGNVPQVETAEGRYSSNACDQMFKFSSPKVHSSGKKFECDMCNRIFSDRGNMKKHRLTHSGTKPYMCSVCNKAFTQSGSLTKHKRTHTGDRPYMCYICDKAFRFSSNLTKHLRCVHSSDKPNTVSCNILCDLCGKTFATMATYTVHKRIHTGQKPYSCDICNVSFSDSSQFVQHKRIHTRDRPYECDLCGMTFRQSSCLHRHRRIHTGIKPYACDICDRAFTQSSQLKNHKLTHTNERAFKCDVCNKSFNRLGNLRTHRSNMHAL